MEDKPKIRKYSVIPARAVQDDNLKPTTFRLLAALCLYTNAYGICWPTQKTLGRHISLHHKNVSKHIQFLIKAGYVRKLKPRRYGLKHQPPRGRMPARYQVLFDGPQTELPTYEEFWAPRPKVAEDSHGEIEQDATEQIRRGSGGENNAGALLLAQAFCSALNASCGILAAPENNLPIAEHLFAHGVTVDQVSSDTGRFVTQALSDGSSIPRSLEAVAGLARWEELKS